jgi:ABC-type nitrate/sulfonate/bicarbonate transport system permease component
VKVASTLAVIGATIGEWVRASAGLGYLMAQDTAQLNTTRVFAALVVLGAFGMAFFGGVGLIEGYSMPWIYRPIATVSFGAIDDSLQRECRSFAPRELRQW